ncbi:MAG: hypothetical protein OEY89_17340, partial [Gammaproteobacteria bacterium]|nr:hypothetical protein [Gammaproteobacteria bacterium]
MKLEICPVCNGTRLKFVFKSFNIHGRHIINDKDEFNLVKCSDCSLIFINNIDLNDDYYVKYYNLGYYENNDADNSLMLRAFEKLSK